MAHNAAFDQSFVMATAERTGVNVIHSTLLGCLIPQHLPVYVWTNSARQSMPSEKIPFDGKQAHSALYDTERTAELFCYMVNHLKILVVSAYCSNR